MRARYFYSNSSWILVTVLEKVGTLYRIHPVEWVGVEDKDLYVSEALLEFVFADRP